MKLPHVLLKHFKKDSFSREDQARWFTLLGELLSVGFSIKQALSFSMTLMPKQSAIMKHIDTTMADGKTFAQGVCPFVGRDIYYQLLIAEQHGNLQKSIQQTGIFLTLSLQQHRKLSALLQYPAILMGLLGALLVGLKVFLFPELTAWENGESPGIGKLELLPWLFSGIGCGTIIIVASIVYRWARSSTMSRVTLLCQLPIIGKIYQQYYAYYLITNLALLLENGMGVHEICQMFRQFDSRSLLNQLGSQLDCILDAGQSPAQMIRKYPYLPQELIVFMNKGETVERLGQQLTVFAGLIFNRLVRHLERLLTLVQPLLFGVIALAIVAMYLSILLPMYQSMKGIY